MEYTSLKATELKDELKKRGIPSTGLSKKQDIIARLIEDDQSKSNQEDADDAHIETGLEEDTAMTGDGGDEKSSEPNAIDQRAESGQTGANEGATESIDAKMDSSNPQDDDRSKRKRRSHSPALSASSVTKRIKTAEDDPVHLEGDAAQGGRLSNDPASTGAQNGISGGNAHPATSALYINELVRPLRKAELKEHIESLSSSGPQAIINLHLDALRSHALVLFEDVDTATLVRDKLHGTVFPDEPQRKPLWVGYVPSDSVLEWIQIEQQSNTRPSSSQRFEVRYTTSPDGRVSATYTNAESTLPNPKGPRAAQPDAAATPSKRPMINLNQTHSFPLTNTEPRLYYKTAPSDLISSRLSALGSESSTNPDQYSTSDPSQLRRTAFQDGTDLVDAGPDHNPRRGGNGPSSNRGGRGRGAPRGGGRWQGRDNDRFSRPPPAGAYRDDGFRRDYRDPPPPPPPAPYRDEYRGGGYRDDGPRYDSYRGGGAPYREEGGYYRGGPPPGGEPYDGGYYRGGGGGGYRDDGYRGGPDRYRDEYHRGGGGPPDPEWGR